MRTRMGSHDDEVNASSQNVREVELVARITRAGGSGGSASNDEGGTMGVCFDLLTLCILLVFFYNPTLFRGWNGMPLLLTSRSNPSLCQVSS